MKIHDFVSTWQARVEIPLVGNLTPDVRRNMYLDLSAASIRSFMTTIVAFIPIILWRAGASTEQVAYYFSSTVLGLITSGVSVWIMRRWGMKRFALICWVLGRGSFLLTALAFNTTSLLAIFTFFWLLEAWTAPAYNQTMQTIYPMEQRGRILAAVRVGLVGLTIFFTPLAGRILDHLGYRVLLPMVGIFGIGSTLIFSSLLHKVPDRIAEPSRPELSSWHILQTDGRMIYYLGGILLFGLGTLISAPLYPAIQSDKLNLSYTALGQLGFVQSLFWFLGCLFGGRVLERFGGIRSLQIIFVINVFVMLPYIWATQGWMLLPSFVAAGLVTAGTDLAILFAVIQLAGPLHVPEYSALNATVYGLRGLLGPFLGSTLVRMGLPYWIIFGLSIILTLMGAVVMAQVAKIHPALES